MSNEDGTVWTVFNGEIYNHVELRDLLQARGHIFKGHSDTEVIPHLYEEEGPAFVDKLRGMFALAIYDTRRHTLVLARDRFGIKPLFYTLGKERLAFASEINALLEFPDVDHEPDRQAIFDFATLFYIPAPETFYTGIRALQPGEILEANLEPRGVSWDTRFYHRWSITPDLGLTLNRATRQANELIIEAVRRQMESDVPLGSLLSGGIDSSLVSVAAQEILDGKLQTFNVRFPEEEFDETWAAVAVAEQINSQHRILDMEGVQGSWEHITSLILHAGQPFADTSFFAVNAVCRAMRQYVTVALSGDGGDEGFGGYHLYWQIARIARLQILPSMILRMGAFAMALFSRFGLAPASMSQRLRDLTGADDTTIIQSLFCWLREADHRSLCRDSNLLPIRRLFEPQWEHSLARSASRLERLSAHVTEVNLRLSLPGDFLFKVDMASMKESLEVRVPMLDEDLFAFGLSLPHDLKVKGRTCKRILRAVAEQRLPPSVAKKPKMGFGIPVDKWVDQNFKERLRETLLGESTSLPEFFRPSVYRPMVEAFYEGRPCRGMSREGLYRCVIMLLSVHVILNRSPKSFQSV
jgi:asparagine synthase (glutamine-hydrolysing)